MQERKDIRQASREEIKKYIETVGEKKFRAMQIYEWLWKKSATSFEEMTNLSKELRGKLEEHFVINKLEQDIVQKSNDGTIKVGFRLFDGKLIEGVLIPSNDRVTACISSQVGCSLDCKFCATGFLSLKRNLQASEIYDQVVQLNRIALVEYERNLTNIVFMGMGEPLLNYKNVLDGIDKITSEDGLHIAARRITVSTAGIAKMIKKLGDDEVRFNLALSLHSANDKTRGHIMPINESNSLEILVEALNHFYNKTKGDITFEYILLDGINDSFEDAIELMNLCRKVHAKVNIIEYNPVEDVPFQKSKPATFEKFVAVLEQNRVIVKVRRSRGKDIDAACGQLANKSI